MPDDWGAFPVAEKPTASSDGWDAFPVAALPKSGVAQEDDQSGVEPPHTGFFSGIADAAAAGVKSDAASLSVIPDALKGKVAAEPPAQPKPFEAPLAWEDIYKDPALAAQKITYELAGSGSILAGGYAGARVGAPLGAAIGTGIGMFGGPAAPATAPIGAGLGSAIGAVAGSAVGAAAVGGLKSLKPYLAEELAKPDVDPADAYKAALLRATQEGAFTGAGWALFHAGAASGTLMHIALQAFGIQPGVHIAKTGIENLEQGKPLTEGMAEGLPSAVVGTAVPLAGFAAIHAAGPSKPAITTPLKTAFQDMATQTDNLQKTPTVPTPDANASDTQARDALNAAVSPTTPEPTADIAAQVAAVADHTNPKGAVFVAAGNEASIPPTLPEGMVRVDRPEGTLLTNNPDKATAFKTGPMDDAKIAELLNYTEPKADAIASGDPRIVQGQDANGNVVRDEVVSPKNVPDAIAAASAETPGGTAGEVPVEDALARRNQDDPLPTTLDFFNPDQIGVDAQKFQFKTGGDENGVTDRLQGVTQWDQIISGVGLVWQDANGKNWVADGHQRLALAQKLQREGQQGIKFNAYVIKETDGITSADARYIAAAKNVAEGTGTRLDAAKMFRESAALGIRMPPMPPRWALARDGKDIARLSDDAFGFVVNGIVPENQSAVVGRLVTDPLQQVEAMRVLTAAKPANPTQAEMIVRDMLSTGTVKATQRRLFGDEMYASSVVLERAQIIDDALNLVKKDKSVFRLLVKDAENIQAHGENSLDTDANQNRLTTDEQTTATLANLATRHGPVSDALTVLARQLQDGTITRANAGRSFLENVRREIQTPVAARDQLGRSGYGDENPGAEPPVEGQGGFFSRRDDRQAALEKTGFQRDQTETPEFKRWFGGSKVVDAEGKPLVVYHGTGREISEFRAAGDQGGKLGAGIYVTPEPQKANLFAKIREKDGAANVLPLYASIKKPFIINGERNIPVMGVNRVRIESLGHDGIFLYDDSGATLREAVAFHPEQIKSAVGNNGAFNSADPRINFSRRDDRQPLLSDKLGLERAGQGVIPGAEASAKQAIQARDEAALRSKVPQKSMDDLGLFSSGNKQGSLFSTRDTVKSETHAQDAADARTATPEAQTARVRLYNLVQATMRYMGLPEDVGLRFVDRLLDEHGGEADGAYANRILTMALDTAPAEMPLRVTHEIIHAIRMLNPEIKLLTSGQMRALESGAKAWLKDRSVDDRTKTNAEYLADIGYDQSHMVEEGIARIGERALARAVQPGMAQTYGRITNFLTGIGRMMRGEGYTSADDVFRSLFQGDKASTEARTGLDNALMGKTAPPVSSAVPSTGDDVVDAINHARANQPDTYFSRRDQISSDDFAQLLADAKNRIADRKILTEQLSTSGNSVKMTRANGDTALISRDMSREEGWRVTRFDKAGPYGHTEFTDAEKAISSALQDGFKPNDLNTNYARRDDRVPLFSPVARAVDSLRQTKGTGEQFLAQISKMPGVKPEELKWMGIGDWLRGQKSITKEQVADYVRANSMDVREVMKGGQADADKKMISSLFAQYYERTGTPGLVAGRETPEFLASSENAERLRLIAEEPSLRATKHEQWKLPGGENYRELLLTLPPKGVDPRWFEYGKLDERAFIRHLSDLDQARYDELDKLAGSGALGPQPSNDVPEYSSSHWQEPNVLAHVRFDDRTAPDGKKVLMVQEIQSDWHQAGRRQGYNDPVAQEEIKRLVASENKMISDVAARHGLASQGGQLESDAFRRMTIPEQTSFVTSQERRWALDKGHQVPDAPFKTTWPSLAMKRVVKYAADNGYDRVAWSPGEVHADRYPGTKREGMQGFYDKILPAETQKIVGKFGAKVGSSKIDVPNDKYHVDVSGGPRDGIDNDEPPYTKDAVHSFDITPEMRAAVADQGLPLFARRDTPASPADVAEADKEHGPPLTGIRGTVSRIADAAREQATAYSDSFKHTFVPIAGGTMEARVFASRFANTQALIAYRYGRVIDALSQKYSAVELKKMFTALDDQSMFELELRDAKLAPSEEATARSAFKGRGLDSLDETQRTIVTDLDALSKETWARMQDRGLVNPNARGLPFWAPRFFVRESAGLLGMKSERVLPDRPQGITDPLGLNLNTNSPGPRLIRITDQALAAMREKYGGDVNLVRDIRTLPRALAAQERSIAGVDLVRAIKKYGDDNGLAMVASEVPADKRGLYVTHDHPALREFRMMTDPKTGEVIRDAEGNTISQQVPMLVHKDFAGPLKAVLTGPPNALYMAALRLKSAAVGIIMLSPFAHLGVVFSKALPLLPGKVASLRAFFDGNRIRNTDPARMEYLIQHGLRPIGGSWMSDALGLHDAQMGGQFSIPAKIVGAAVRGIAGDDAGTRVSGGIDKAIQFWHGTLLWDRVYDLQVGVAHNLAQHFEALGRDPEAAAIAASHEANRAVGALPREAMSAFANGVANLGLFSRSFTLGNLGIYKDAVNGGPSYVRAQIEHASGVAAADLAAKDIKSGTRKAIIMDIGLFIGGTALLQSVVNMASGRTSGDQELDGYWQRMKTEMARLTDNPLEFLNPVASIERLSPTHENAMGSQSRIFLGLDKNGAGIYVRNPLGKFGEDLIGWLPFLGDPAKTLDAKIAPYLKPILEVLANEKSEIGGAVYDRSADTVARKLKALGDVTGHVMTGGISQPVLSAMWDAARGNANEMTAIKALASAAGLMVSGSTPPAIQQANAVARQRRFEAESARTAGKPIAQNGDTQAAIQTMIDAGMSPKDAASAAKRFGRTMPSPNALKDYWRNATPEQYATMQKLLQQGARP